MLKRSAPSATCIVFTSTSCGAIRSFFALLQPAGLRRIRLLAALLARAPPAPVLEVASPPALCAFAPRVLVYPAHTYGHPGSHDNARSQELEPVL